MWAAFICKKKIISPSLSILYLHYDTSCEVNKHMLLCTSTLIVPNTSCIFTWCLYECKSFVKYIKCLWKYRKRLPNSLWKKRVVGYSVDSFKSFILIYLSFVFCSSGPSLCLIPKARCTWWIFEFCYGIWSCIEYLELFSGCNFYWTLSMLQFRFRLLWM